MLHLLLSVALAASTSSPNSTSTHSVNSPQAIPISTAAAKLNAHLPEEQHIIVPSQGSRIFFSTITDYQKSSSKSKTTKKVLKISDLSIQGCNAYSWEPGAPLWHLPEFADAFKVAREQVAHEGSLSKALQLARLGLMAAQCKGPAIFASQGLNWLNSSLELIKSLPKKHIKKEDKAHLKALQEQVLALDEAKLMKEVLRFETVSAFAIAAGAIQEGHAFDLAPGSEESFSNNTEVNFWKKISAGTKVVMDWDRDAKISSDILIAISNSKAPDFKAYHNQIEKEYDTGLENIWKELKLADQGFTSSAEMRSEKKWEDLYAKMNSDDGTLRTLQDNFKAHPEIAADITRFYLHMFALTDSFFAHFDSRLQEIKTLAHDIAK